MSLCEVRDLGRLDGPLLIFGGPYGNLPATEKLRQIADEREIPPGRVICTGDLVAYCAEPEETVELVRTWGIPVVMGNCEQSLAARAADCGCGFESGTVCSALSAEWFRFADHRISEESRSWMGDLPQMLSFQLAGRRFSVVHGGVSQINRFLFASTPAAEKRSELNRLGGEIDGLIAGHCGIPFGQLFEGKAWLNAGVIGLPANDGTPDGWYLILEPHGEQLRASWHRLHYPAELTRQTMITAGLTAGYAETICSGLWPSEDVLPAIERKDRGRPIGLNPLVF